MAIDSSHPILTAIIIIAVGLAMGILIATRKPLLPPKKSDKSRLPRVGAGSLDPSSKPEPATVKVTEVKKTTKVKTGRFSFDGAGILASVLIVAGLLVVGYGSMWISDHRILIGHADHTGFYYPQSSVLGMQQQYAETHPADDGQCHQNPVTVAVRVDQPSKAKLETHCRPLMDPSPTAGNFTWGCEDENGEEHDPKLESDACIHHTNYLLLQRISGDDESDPLTVTVTFATDV